MNRNEAWNRAVTLIPEYGALLELRAWKGVWQGRYVREDIMPFWAHVMAVV